MFTCKGALHKEVFLFFTITNKLGDIGGIQYERINDVYKTRKA